MRDRRQNRGCDHDLGQEAEALRAAWSKLEPVDPPEILDQVILNAARRDLQYKTRRTRRGWLAALATAVVMVLALAITVQQDQQGPVPPVSRNDGFKLERDAPATAPAESGDRGREQIQARRLPPASYAAPAKTLGDTDTGQPMAESTEEGTAPPDPELWVQRMLRLHRSGRQQELEAELAAFRKAYPDYSLPQELLD